LPVSIFLFILIFLQIIGGRSRNLALLWAPFPIIIPSPSTTILVLWANPSDSQRCMDVLHHHHAKRGSGDFLHNFLVLHLYVYVQDHSDCSCCVTSKSFQQTLELGGTSWLRKFDGSAKMVGRGWSRTKLGPHYARKLCRESPWQIRRQYIQHCESDGKTMQLWAMIVQL
jgi:hypothetical protein